LIREGEEEERDLRIQLECEGREVGRAVWVLLSTGRERRFELREGGGKVMSSCYFVHVRRSLFLSLPKHY